MSRTKLLTGAHAARAPWVGHSCIKCLPQTAGPLFHSYAWRKRMRKQNMLMKKSYVEKEQMTNIKQWLGVAL